MPDILFPLSTAPGVVPQESSGRLINCYAERLEDQRIAIKRAPGLNLLGNMGYSGIRGFLEVNDGLYAVAEDRAVYMTWGGGALSVTDLGAMSGSDRVTLARNNKTPVPDVVAVTELATYTLTPSSLSQLIDADLPQPIGVTFLDGYFVFAISDGRFFNSGLNDTTIAAIDFAKAESRADGLLRAVGHGEELYLFGEKSLEIWRNAGNATGSPFSRTLVIPRGLAAKFAVAGHEEGWAGQIIFVGDDNIVYLLSGYQLQRVSTSDLERRIEALSDKSVLDAAVYMQAGKPIWSLTCDDWTWEFDLAAKTWRERKSYGLSNWRGYKTVKAFDKWLAGSATSDKIFEITEAAREEDSEPLVMEAHSLPASGFPARLRVNRADFNFAVGQGMAAGRDPIQTDPSASISWSDDGGATFSNELIRSLGRQGEYENQVTVTRTGLTGQKGRIWRIQQSGPVHVALMGGTMEIEGRRS